MILREPAPPDPRAAEAAERLAIAARRAFKRTGDFRRLAAVTIDSLGSLADLAAGRRSGKALAALERHGDLLLELAAVGPTKPLRRPLPRPRHHLLADDEEGFRDDEE